MGHLPHSAGNTSSKILVGVFALVLAGGVVVARVLMLASSVSPSNERSVLVVASVCDVQRLREGVVGYPTDSSFVFREEDGNRALFAVTHQDAVETRTGLVIPRHSVTDLPFPFALSFDRKMVAFVRWSQEVNGREIILANTSGSYGCILERQEVGEGGGELQPYSLEWEAGDTAITYKESQSYCDPASCQGVEDIKTTIAAYRVDIAASKATLVNRALRK